METHLHPNDGVDEEDHGDEQSDVGQSLREEGGVYAEVDLKFNGSLTASPTHFPRAQPRDGPAL